MRTAEQWDKLSNTAMRPAIAEEVKHVLAGHIGTMGTGQLINMLYPKAMALTAKQSYGRQRLFKAVLNAAREELAAYCTKKAPDGSSLFGKAKQPWDWHAPKTEVMCVMCGQKHFE